MKKTYIAPEMEVLNIETAVMMANSVMSIGTSDETIDSNEALSGGRRGTWGDRWE